MDIEKTSLHTLVDKWLGASKTRPLRVTEFGRTSFGVRYVSVEVLRLVGPLRIAFFRHKDGACACFHHKASGRD